MGTASILGEVSHLVPTLLSKQDVICLDSSGDEDEKVEPKLPSLAIRDGKKDDGILKLYCSYFQVIQQYENRASSHTMFTSPIMTQM